MTDETPPDETELEDIQYQLPRLNIPDPPPGMTYDEMDDFRQAEILKANGIPLETEPMLAVLRNSQHPLQSSAAHTLGARGITAAMDVLNTALDEGDELVQTEAAYALVRLGDTAAQPHLVDLLSDSVHYSVHPALAAGYLARLGDPQGYGVMVEGMHSQYLISRMVTCKQLYFFVPHNGKTVNGDTVAIFDLFDRALQDVDESVQWQALAQLEELRAPQSRDLLKAFVQRSPENYLRNTAKQILRTL